MQTANLNFCLDILEPCLLGPESDFLVSEILYGLYGRSDLSQVGHGQRQERVKSNDTLVCFWRCPWTNLRSSQSGADKSSSYSATQSLTRTKPRRKLGTGNRFCSLMHCPAMCTMTRCASQKLVALLNQVQASKSSGYR